MTLRATCRQQSCLADEQSNSGCQALIKSTSDIDTSSSTSIFICLSTTSTIHQISPYTSRLYSVETSAVTYKCCRPDVYCNGGTRRLCTSHVLVWGSPISLYGMCHNKTPQCILFGILQCSYNRSIFDLGVTIRRPLQPCNKI